MASPTKNQKIEALVKLVQRRSRGAGLSTPPQRTVLETLMYAALLENATFDKADIAYAVLENYYIDWNEIRVCSVRELADTLTDLPQPEAAAERIRKALQGIFEKTYMFDLEEMRKKGKALAEHVKVLVSMSASPYMIQYTAQVALDAHLIPFDEASLRIMRRLGLSQISGEGAQEICIGLDRVVLKKSGLSFATQLHHFAAGFFDVPDSPELLSQLSAIDPEAVNRSWASPALTPSKPVAAAEPPSPASVPKSEPSKAAVPTEKAKPAPKASIKAAPAVTSVKPVSKPSLKSAPTKLPAKSVEKPAKKVVPMNSAAVSPGKSTANGKKTPPNTSMPVKKMAIKKASPPNKPVKPSLPKKKAEEKKVVKKSPEKPVKKPRTVSPSKALRQKKPK